MDCPSKKGKKNKMCKGLKVENLVGIQTTDRRSMWLTLGWAVLGLSIGELGRSEGPGCEGLPST